MRLVLLQNLRLRALLSCGIALVVLAGQGCGAGEAPDREPAGPPTIFFAIDGLEWSVLQPLLADGRLPAIASLMARGSFGRLRSMTPTLSPVIWTSVATGKRRERHGIDHFIYTGRGPAGPETHYYTSGHRRTKAFWNVLSDHGRVVHCFGWWITFPAEPINGVMVSQTNTIAAPGESGQAIWKGTIRKGIDGQVHPPEMQDRIMDLLDEVCLLYTSDAADE